MNTHARTTYMLSVAPDGQHVVVAAGRQLHVCLMNDRSFGMHSTHAHPGTNVTSAAITPDGKYIISGGEDACLRMWTMPRVQYIAQLNVDDHVLHAVTSLAVAPNGSFVVSSHSDGCIHITPLFFKDTHGHMSEPDIAVSGKTWRACPAATDMMNVVVSLLVTNDSQNIICCDTTGCVFMLSVQHNNQQRVWSRHDAHVQRLLHTDDDGTCVLCCSCDGTCAVWLSLADGSPRAVCDLRVALHGVASIPASWTASCWPNVHSALLANDQVIACRHNNKNLVLEVFNIKWGRLQHMQTELYDEQQLLETFCQHYTESEQLKPALHDDDDDDDNDTLLACMVKHVVLEDVMLHIRVLIRAGVLNASPWTLLIGMEVP